MTSSLPAELDQKRGSALGFQLQLRISDDPPCPCSPLPLREWAS